VRERQGVWDKRFYCQMAKCLKSLHRIFGNCENQPGSDWFIHISWMGPVAVFGKSASSPPEHCRNDAAWIPGFPHRFALLRPRMTKERRCRQPQPLRVTRTSPISSSLERSARYCAKSSSCSWVSGVMPAGTGSGGASPCAIGAGVAQAASRRNQARTAIGVKRIRRRVGCIGAG
jgi:hypothetical protein